MKWKIGAALAAISFALVAYRQPFAKRHSEAVMSLAGLYNPTITASPYEISAPPRIALVTASLFTWIDPSTFWA